MVGFIAVLQGNTKPAKRHKQHSFRSDRKTKSLMRIKLCRKGIWKYLKENPWMAKRIKSLVLATHKIVRIENYSYHA